MSNRMLKTLTPFQRETLQYLANGPLLSATCHPRISLWRSNQICADGKKRRFQKIADSDPVGFHDEKPVPEAYPFDDPIPF